MKIKIITCHALRTTDKRPLPADVWLLTQNEFVRYPKDESYDSNFHTPVCFNKVRMIDLMITITITPSLANQLMWITISPHVIRQRKFAHYTHMEVFCCTDATVTTPKSLPDKKNNRLSCLYPIANARILTKKVSLLQNAMWHVLVLTVFWPYLVFVFALHTSFILRNIKQWTHACLLAQRSHSCEHLYTMCCCCTNIVTSSTITIYSVLLYMVCYYIWYSTKQTTMLNLVYSPFGNTSILRNLKDQLLGCWSNNDHVNIQIEIHTSGMHLRRL